MFYSTDLLTLRGGKFNLIWLLSTANDKNAILRKRKKDLLSLDVGNVAQELVKMFPVQGKKVSLSLRTSSLLMHGVFVSFRMKAELLRMDVMKLLSPSKYKLLFFPCHINFINVLSEIQSPERMRVARMMVSTWMQDTFPFSKFPS